jgi:uncharacterized protein YbbK (DUF523 family)/uncharacterized protein YbgA (DUF1722 family)
MLDAMSRPLHPPEFPRPRLGVSACLLGEPVRYDGGHKRHAFLVEVLAAHIDCVPFCPEAGIGMGVPRPTIQLVGGRGTVRAVGVQDPSMDVTARLQQYAGDRLTALGTLSGFLLKKDSPSCGLRRVKQFAAPGRGMQRRGTGIFAAAVSTALPLLPLAQEDELDDPLRRDNFICRLYTCRRWQTLLNKGLTAAALETFHATHSHLVMAHSQAAAQRLSRLLGSCGSEPIEATGSRYLRELLTSLARPTTRERHSVVLSDLAMHLKPQLDGARRTDLTRQLDAYRDGQLPLFEIHQALREQFRHCEPTAPAGLGQAYLYPYPDSLRADSTRTTPEKY